MKKISSLLLLTTLLITSSSFQNKPLTEYCNGRFGYCINYPAALIPQGEAANADGQTFLSKDKQTVVTTYGMLALEEVNDNLQENFALETKNIQVTYKVIKANSYLFSGLNKEGKIVYQKSVLKKIAYMGEEKEETLAWQTLSITYPKAQQATYGSYCSVIAKSL